VPATCDQTNACGGIRVVILLYQIRERFSFGTNIRLQCGQGERRNFDVSKRATSAENAKDAEGSSCFTVEKRKLRWSSG